MKLTATGVKSSFPNLVDNEELSIAFLLPFLGRFSCSVAADVVTHVKQGGMCVFKDWEKDFLDYLHVLRTYLIEQSVRVKSENQVINHGDARIFDFPKRRFSAMYTSPPYPNHRDFSSMFKPEHELLKILGKDAKYSSENSVIGSNFVRNKEIKSPKGVVPLEFLEKISQLEKRRKFQISHDDVYYLPYLRNYFADLEAAYGNVEKALAPRFRGFIVVVDNTHRGLVIPVAEAVIEIWQNLGYKAEIFTFNERAHVGAKNPRSKGIRAVHTESVIEIWN